MKNYTPLTMHNGTPSIRLIRINDVVNLTAISKAHIYTLARQGKFPKARKQGVNTSVWLESEVLDWIYERLGLSSTMSATE
ncbi:MAG: AlpA family phage regulatory protein [Gammaproteobacteria bacterium]|nr:AlpA family phage regulatory protein [Gammaproteobacteria bacterium]